MALMGHRSRDIYNFYIKKIGQCSSYHNDATCRCIYNHQSFILSGAHAYESDRKDQERLRRQRRKEACNTDNFRCQHCGRLGWGNLDTWGNLDRVSIMCHSFLPNIIKQHFISLMSLYRQNTFTFTWKEFFLKLSNNYHETAS